MHSLTHSLNHLGTHASPLPPSLSPPEGATCNTIRCWRGQKCLTQEVSGQPQCTSCGALDSCLPSSRPVCASDGRVYPSWCAFKHEACRSGRALTPTLHLHCAASEYTWTRSLNWFGVDCIGVGRLGSFFMGGHYWRAYLSLFLCIGADYK